MKNKTYVIAKLLQAAGLASLIIGLVQGIYGDMWGELYLFIGGIIIFTTGRIIEIKSRKPTNS
ncbi:MAG TPA: hypothetical protein VFF29_02730 [Bacteroidota bacterium]|nr:hypothetical protein [Bacteroidota bacterium]